MDKINLRCKAKAAQKDIGAQPGVTMAASFRQLQKTTL
jgi:hypothetical protein